MKRFLSRPRIDSTPGILIDVAACVRSISLFLILAAAIVCLNIAELAIPGFGDLAEKTAAGGFSRILRSGIPAAAGLGVETAQAAEPPAASATASSSPASAVAPSAVPSPDAATPAVSQPAPVLPPPSAVVKFGCIFPLTGPSASWGLGMERAAKLAYEESDPEIQRKIAIVFEDDQMKPANAISAFNKLMSIDHVRGLVVFGGESVGAVAPLAEKQEIPMFAITASKDVVKGKLYTFRHWLDASEQVRTLLPFMIEHDIHSIAIVVTTHDAMLEYITKFSIAAAQSDIEIQSKTEFTPQEGEFKAVIGTLKENPPDAVLVALLPPQISLFTRKLRDAGVDTPIFGFANTETLSEVRAAAGAMDGMVYSAPRMSADFIKRYQDRYGEFPELAAGNVYDMVKIFGAAVKAGATDSKAIANALRRLKDFEGVMGAYSIGEDNDFSLPAMLKRVKRGSFRRIDEQ